MRVHATVHRHDLTGDISTLIGSEIDAQMSREQRSLEDVLCNELLAKQIFDDIANDDPVIGRIFYLHFVCDMKLDDVVALIRGEEGTTVHIVISRAEGNGRKKYEC